MHDAPHTIHGLFKAVEMTAQGVRAYRAVDGEPLEHLGPSVDDGQGVAQLMGDPRGQPAEVGQFLTAEEGFALSSRLLLCPLSCRDVFIQASS